MKNGKIALEASTRKQAPLWPQGSALSMSFAQNPLFALFLVHDSCILFHPVVQFQQGGWKIVLGLLTHSAAARARSSEMEDVGSNPLLLRSLDSRSSGTMPLPTDRKEVASGSSFSPTQSRVGFQDGGMYCSALSQIPDELALTLFPSPPPHTWNFLLTVGR